MDPVLAETIVTVSIVCFAGFTVIVAAFVGIITLIMRTPSES